MHYALPQLTVAFYRAPVLLIVVIGIIVTGGATTFHKMGDQSLVSHRRRVSGPWGLSPPPNILGQNFDCLLCFDSHNAISPELKIRLFMYYSWPLPSTQCSSVNRLSSLVKHCLRLCHYVCKQRAACSELDWTEPTSDAVVSQRYE